MLLEAIDYSDIVSRKLWISAEVSSHYRRLNMWQFFWDTWYYYYYYYYCTVYIVLTIIPI